jgi:SAM-dependent methyltransferase
VNLLEKIRNFLREPRLDGVDLNSEKLIELHQKILYEKKMMREVFIEFYKKCAEIDHNNFEGKGKRVEIGAGVSFFKKIYPDLIVTDIKKADNIDMVIDAMDMDFDDESVRAIYGINCFHHFPYPDKFFCELSRVLEKGGGCILIEPYYGFVASRFFKKLFDTENFDKSQKEWFASKNLIMKGANQALSYIVFKRDVDQFNERYLKLEIIMQKPLNNYLRYLLSGGLNFRSLMPAFTSPLLKFIEFLLIPLNKLLSLHHIIAIRKRS